MMISVMVPSLGSGIETVELVAWHKKEGDWVDPEEDMVELVADKASFCVPSPVRGQIKKIYASEGATLAIGDLLADMESES